jgi:hypothetical protein
MKTRVAWTSDIVRSSPPSCAPTSVISLRPPGDAEKNDVTRSKRATRAK